MTPVPLDLPLRPPEAAELAGLVFETAERKPLTDEVRNRIAARAGALRLETIAPHFGSLARDPIHHSTYYIAIDTSGGEAYLLHMAMAAAPTSSIFHRPLLIGRMRRATGPEILINAVPFGPEDADALEKFTVHVDKAFLPRPHGSQTTIVAGTETLAALPGIFDAFRGVWKRTGRNVASIGASGNVRYGGVYYAAIWAAIRTGWRQGYSAVARISAGSVEEMKEAVREAALFSTFALDPARELEDVARTVALIRQTRSALKINRPFEIELALDRSPSATSPEELALCLGWLKARNCAVQLATPNFQGADEGRIHELAAVCRNFQCGLGVAVDEVSAGLIEQVSRATGGKVACSLWGPGTDGAGVERAAESLLG